MSTTILIADYFGKWINHPDLTDKVMANAIILLDRVNPLLDAAFEDGIDLQINPLTGSFVAGNTYGGFRPQDCPQGAPQSSHKQGMAVDVFDKTNELDEWAFKNQDRLRLFDLYIEHPQATPRWCHLTTRPPGSGKRVFLP